MPRRPNWEKKKGILAMVKDSEETHEKENGRKLGRNILP